MRTRTVLLLIAWLLQASPRTTGTIQGIVMRAGTADAISDVTISVTPASNSVPANVVRQSPLETSVSDHDGHFSMSNLPPGRYTLRVQSPGYSSASNVFVVMVTAGRASEVNLPLIPDVVIRGRILDSEGHSVPNVAVEALIIDYRQGNGIPFLQSAVSKITDDQGNYRLFGIPPGEYLVAVTPHAPTANTTPVSGTVRSVKTYYPGVRNSSEATAIKPRGGEEITGINIAMQTGLHVRVSGKVINTVPLATPPSADGVFAVIGQTQVNTANLMLVARDLSVPDDARMGSNVPVLLNASSGEFEIADVLPGLYELYATVNAQTGIAIGRTPVDVIDRDVTGLTVVARPGIEVHGTIHFEDSAGVSEALRVGIQPMDSLLRMGCFYCFILQSQSAAPSGTFSIPDVPDGKFRLSVGVPASFYVDDILQNGRSVYDSGFEVRDGNTEPLQVVVKSGSGTVSGVVRDTDAKSVYGASVVLLPAMRSENPQLQRSATSDFDGNFVIGGIAPGEYKIFALPVAASGPSLNTSFVAKYQTDASRVTVTSNAATKADVIVRSDEP